MRTITAQRLSDLPAWDVVVNQEGFPLFAGRHTPHFAIIAQLDIGTRVDPDAIDWQDYKNNKRQVGLWLVTSEEFRRINPNAIMSAVSRMKMYPGFYLNGHVHASEEVVEAIHQSFQHRRESVGEANSDEHKLFDRIGQDALERGASDIHITLFPETTEIKLRIKGELRHYMDLSRGRGEAMIASAYNTLAETGSTKEGFNERAYQDGVIERVYPQGLVRFRYSGMPIAPAGADITLRLIPIGVESKRRSLIELGYSPDQVEQLDRIFSRSSGMILIAGTTGSGKSTTIATILEEMAERYPSKKIRTVEQPVEYRIRGAYQTPVLDIESKEPGKSPFLVALRQIMRADPDVIAVGEIRDIETANVAIQGVRSGHLLVSTIHADGAPVCYDRLSGMGVSRLDLATIGLIAGLIYQKLVPILCDHCKIPYEKYAQRPDADKRLLKRLQNLTQGDVHGIYFRNPEGCPHCHHDGVTHREVVAEILRPTPEMSHAVALGDSAAIWKAWRSTIKHDDPSNMTGRTAFEHALYKMRQGRVSPQDVESAFKYVDEPAFDLGG